jgi:hypothetical protein
MNQRIKSLDEYKNANRNATITVNEDIVGSAQNDIHSKKRFITDNDGVKYELYELKKEDSGFATDIFIGYRN